jgi:hypothetical protein
MVAGWREMVDGALSDNVTVALAGSAGGQSYRTIDSFPVVTV